MSLRNMLRIAQTLGTPISELLAEAEWRVKEAAKVAAVSPQPYHRLDRIMWFGPQILANRHDPNRANISMLRRGLKCPSLGGVVVRLAEEQSVEAWEMDRGESA